MAAGKGNTNDQQELPKADELRSKLLGKLPAKLADSYSDEQVEGIRILLGDRTWGRHSIDSRGTFSLPFVRWRYYWVLLLGKNRRAYTRTEKQLSLALFVICVLVFLLMSLLLGLLGLYLLKSMLGIDLFSETSLGIWDWFKS
ncbi:hypothetical protein [Shewanella sp.]|uniref:hypothetical protein n=1 Tax=Shewanella sp. TaxID=50422 RepID=UPI0035648C10